MRWLEFTLSFLLAPRERDAILGDLTEQPSRGEALKIVGYAIARWLTADRALHGVLAVALFNIVASLPVMFPLFGRRPEISVMLYCATLGLGCVAAAAAVLARCKVDEVRRKIAIASAGYAAAVSVSIVISLLAVPVHWTFARAISWAAMIVPMLLILGIVVVALTSIFSRRERVPGLLLAFVPLLGWLVSELTTPIGRANVPLALKMLWPISVLGPTSLRGWTTVADLVLWAAVGYAATRFLRRRALAQPL